MVPFFLVELILRFRALKMRIAMVLTKQNNISFLAPWEKTEPSSLWGGGERQGTRKRSKIYLFFSLGFSREQGETSKKNIARNCMPAKAEVGLCIPLMSHPVQIINVGCLLDICMVTQTFQVPDIRAAKRKKGTLESFCPIQTSFLSWLLAWCNVPLLGRPCFLFLPSPPSMCEGWCQRCFGVGKHVLLPVSWKYFLQVLYFLSKNAFSLWQFPLSADLYPSISFSLSPLLRWQSHLCDGDAGKKKENSKTNLLLQYLTTIQDMLPTVWM